MYSVGDKFLLIVAGNIDFVTIKSIRVRGIFTKYYVESKTKEYAIKCIDNASLLCETSYNNTAPCYLISLSSIGLVFAIIILLLGILVL